jgi:hypothetical protein
MTAARLSTFCLEATEEDVCVLPPPGEPGPSHVEPNGQKPYTPSIPQPTLHRNWAIVRLVRTASLSSWHTASAAINLTRVGACSCVGVGPARNSHAGGVEQPYSPHAFRLEHLWGCTAAISVLATGAIGCDVAVAARVCAFAKDRAFYGLMSW